MAEDFIEEILIVDEPGDIAFLDNALNDFT